MKLTNEEQDLVEKNHNLICGFAKHRDLDLEDWYGELAIVLCKAIKIWNPKEGKLSSLYYGMCENKLKQEYRKRNALKRQDGGLLSLDYEYGNFENTYTLNNYNTEILDDSLEDVVSNKILLEDILDDKFGLVARLRYEGYSQVEISDKLNVSQSYISRILSDMKGEYIFGEIDE